MCFGLLACPEYIQVAHVDRLWLAKIEHVPSKRAVSCNWGGPVARMDGQEATPAAYSVFVPLGEPDLPRTELRNEKQKIPGYGNWAGVCI